MANFKSIADLPVAETAEGLNLIVNDNGSAKQVAASAVGAQADWAIEDEKNPGFIKNKPHKELVYEWNFSVEDEVYEIIENVDDDLTWLTTSDTANFEIVFTVYGTKWNYDESSNDYIPTIVPDAALTGLLGKNGYYTNFYEGEELWLYNYICSGLGSFKSNWEDGGYDGADIYAYIYNKVHMDSDLYPTNVNIGGCLVFSADDDAYIKSVKLYKIID